jgi:hypothetical protein
MRRSTAVTLLVPMLAGLLAPAAVAAATNSLPACCRAGGAHHCAAMVPGATEGGAQFQGQSCPHRKPVACTACAAPPPAAQTVALANAYPFSSEFQPELFFLHREPPHSPRAPPHQSSLK